MRNGQYWVFKGNFLHLLQTMLHFGDKAQHNAICLIEFISQTFTYAQPQTCSGLEALYRIPAFNFVIFIFHGFILGFKAALVINVLCPVTLVWTFSAISIRHCSASMVVLIFWDCTRKMVGVVTNQTVVNVPVASKMRTRFGFGTENLKFLLTLISAAHPL